VEGGEGGGDVRWWNEWCFVVVLLRFGGEDERNRSVMCCLGGLDDSVGSVLSCRLPRVLRFHIEVSKYLYSIKTTRSNADIFASPSIP
jgi:hypothetical protein